MVNASALKTASRIAAFTVAIMLLLGYVIPTAISAATQAIDPNQAEGSPIVINGTVYGSYYLAEAFNFSIFFQPRPSAINYNLSESGAYSYSIDNPQLLNLTREYIHRFLQENPNVTVSELSIDMVSYSASGLDPSIPVADALLQVPRIAQNLSIFYAARDVPVTISSMSSYLVGLISGNEQQNFPVFGSFYVNTVQLDISIIESMISHGIINQSFLN
ncbi:MAG: potassium-transporting ATPase subunit C [Candidatus Thermoplasmatota archaeon]|jgi:K+-transporting ATPase ATPase C chain|nr:potassium-transporting ATPase subunit C [Candidatus Thermoplasmatota archaeon]MCL5794271.1 potassium-transporting ATPase subunit C [Candidatus Thermoplasmatota archaeon]